VKRFLSDKYLKSALVQTANVVPGEKVGTLN